MAILGAMMVPHPPLIIPQVGRGEEKGIAKTIEAYKKAAKRMAELAPDTLLISSPHTTLYGDYFHISPGKHAKGDFSAYGAPEVKIEVDYDLDFTIALESLADARELPAGTFGERNPALDHATMIPLYFLKEYLPLEKVKIVRIGLSGLPLSDHYRLGMLAKQVSDELGRRAVFIGSGDLSHKMKEEGPYGFVQEGPEYDARIMEVMGKAAFGELFDFSDSFCDKAAECGHRSFVIMAGALDGKALSASEATHEATFGVGYGVVSYVAEGEDPGRCFLSAWEKEQEKRLMQRRENEDAYVALARASLENYILRRKKLALPEGLPKEMLEKQAGAFVSIHENGQLRGCIGTISPVQGSVAEEIIENAVSAGTCDPRFPPIRGKELPLLEISVDVLEEPERISGPEELDVKRFGVIVENGGRRGLLLPNLDGIDSVEEQIAIAKRKAGIGPGEKVKLSRFEVVRHEAKSAGNR